MARLTRDQMLAALVKRQTVEVSVPELGGEILLTALSANEKVDWAEAAYPNDKLDMKQYNAGLVSRSILDDEGKPIFSFEEVGAFDSGIVAKLHEAAVKLNGIGAKEVAAIEGKSEGSPDDSGTSS